MTHVTCMLTAKNRDQLRNPTLGNRVWATFFALLLIGANNTQIIFITRALWRKVNGFARRNVVHLIDKFTVTFWRYLHIESCVAFSCSVCTISTTMTPLLRCTHLWMSLFYSFRWFCLRYAVFVFYFNCCNWRYTRCVKKVMAFLYFE